MSFDEGSFKHLADMPNWPRLQSQVENNLRIAIDWDKWLEEDDAGYDNEEYNTSLMKPFVSPPAATQALDLEERKEPKQD